MQPTRFAKIRGCLKARYKHLEILFKKVNKRIKIKINKFKKTNFKILAKMKKIIELVRKVI